MLFESAALWLHHQLLLTAMGDALRKRRGSPELNIKKWFKGGTSLCWEKVLKIVNRFFFHLKRHSDTFWLMCDDDFIQTSHLNGAFITCPETSLSLLLDVCVLLYKAGVCLVLYCVVVNIDEAKFPLSSCVYIRFLVFFASPLLCFAYFLLKEGKCEDKAI